MKLSSTLQARPRESSFYVGETAAMKELMRVVDEIAPRHVTALVGGESGTGKELIARRIHERSGRRGDFVPVNCAALPDALIESELFGHVKGAFTGAIRDRPGRVAMAEGGTLFLDEIGDLSSKGQGDLLRFLEDGFYRPVGSSQLVQADVRVIVATHKDLKALSRKGDFRDDLLYRILVVPLWLPPLRDRLVDIPGLVEIFLTRLCEKHRRPLKRVSPRAMQLLRAMEWPGNIRELRNLIERIVVTHSEIEITPSLLHSMMGDYSSVAERSQEARTLEDVERVEILRVLRESEGNRTKTAKVLGISRRALHYKMKRYKIAHMA